jgi:hypothetical protein
MSTTTSIKCPKCGHQFNVSEALEHSIQEGRAEHEEAIRREALQIGLNQGSARERATWKVSNEELQKDLEATKSALEDAQRVELQMRRGMQQLEEDKRNFELIVQRAVDEERSNLLDHELGPSRLSQLLKESSQRPDGQVKIVFVPAGVIASIKNERKLFLGCRRKGRLSFIGGVSGAAIRRTSWPTVPHQCAVTVQDQESVCSWP